MNRDQQIQRYLRIITQHIITIYTRLERIERMKSNINLLLYPNTKEINLNPILKDEEEI